MYFYKGQYIKKIKFMVAIVFYLCYVGLVCRNRRVIIKMRLSNKEQDRGWHLRVFHRKAVRKLYEARWVWYHTILAVELLILIIIQTIGLFV
jgi:hypothetical protein